jgi:cation:H+ antiporter
VNLLDLGTLVVAFALILGGAELFTNAVEWFGHKLGLGEGAVGSVLAAVGTALPETTIPIVAILFSGGGSDDVGVGAILGAPFMLSTLALGVTGLVVILVARRRLAGRTLAVDRQVVRTDLRSFGAAYLLAIGAAFLPVQPTWPKLVVAVVLVGLYAWYVKGHLEAESILEADGLNPLRLRQLDRARAHLADDPPRLRIVNIQLLAGVIAIVVGAVAFVHGVTDIARGAGLDEVLLTLIIAPVATELPEAANAILWIRRGKDTLAIGNITGAMVFQASIATIVALVFAPAAWHFGPGTQLAFASALIAFLSTAAVFGPLLRGRPLVARGLLLGGGFYAAYLAVVAFEISGG